MIGADCGGSDFINEISLVNRHKVKSSVDNLTVNKSSATIPDPDPDPDSVPFPKENRQVIHCEDGKMSATLFQCVVPMHICQGIITHLTNETLKGIEGRRHY